MLIQDFVQVDAAYARVRSRLSVRPPAWIAISAAAAYSDAEQLLASMAGSAHGTPVRVQVHVDLGTAYARGQGCVVPLSLWAAGAQRLFATLEADLEIMPMGPAQTIVTLMGRYEAPPTAAGPTLERLVLHRITATCVRSLLCRIAADLELAVAA